MNGSLRQKRARQVLAILRLELRKTFLAKRAIPFYLLAILPVLLFTGQAVAALFLRDKVELSFAVNTFGAVFQTFFLRASIFFGCVIVFANLIRGEVLDKSLHYYFLSPVRREVLVVGKFLAGLVATSVVFSAATTVSFLLNYVPLGRAMALDHMLRGPGLGQLFWYLVVTVLACLGYGAVFLAIGLLFKNPMIPALVILGWESINFLLPPLLKRISVLCYLQSLCPFQLPQGTVGILADPVPAWLAVPGLCLVTVALLALSGWRVRRFEISYGAE